MRPASDWFATEYFCDAHRVGTDVELPPEHAFRRVRVTIEVFLAGAGRNAPVSHIEAARRIEDALTAIGAVVDIGAVRSSLVRSWPQPASPQPIGAGNSRG